MGYAFYVYNALMTSVANAAGLGAKMNYDRSSTGAFSTALKNMVVYGNTTTGNRPIAVGLTTENVTVTVTQAGSMPTAITVAIQNYAVDAVFTRLTFSGKLRATASYMGRVVCSDC